MVKSVDMRYRYERWGQALPNTESNCRLRLYQDNGADFIVLSWDDSAEGTSITNLMEVIVNRICGEFGLNRNNLLCFEHYVRSTSPRPTYKKVQFKLLNDEFTDPDWVDVDLQYVERFIGEKLD